MLRPRHHVSVKLRSSRTRLTSRRIDVSRRLRRAILLNDVALVKRIVQNNPHKLRNPDFADKSNTSLHLAAKHGYTLIAVRHDTMPARASVD
jgi:hypothetical protein